MAEFQELWPGNSFKTNLARFVRERDGNRATVPINIPAPEYHIIKAHRCFERTETQDKLF